MFEFLRQHDFFSLISGLVVIACFCIYWQTRGHKMRRRSFQARTRMSEDDWFCQFSPPVDKSRALIKDILSALASDIGVHWTQLRPSDRFKEDLRINPKYMPVDDLEAAERDVIDIVTRHGIDPRQLSGFQGSIASLVYDLASKTEPFHTK